MGCLTAPSQTLLKGASRMIPDGGAPIIKNESNTDIRLSWLLASITATAAYEGTAAAEAFHSGSGRVFPRSGI